MNIQQRFEQESEQILKDSSGKDKGGQIQIGKNIKYRSAVAATVQIQNDQIIQDDSN